MDINVLSHRSGPRGHRGDFSQGLGAHQGLCSRALPETNSSCRSWLPVGLDPARGKSDQVIYRFQEPAAETNKWITKKELDPSVPKFKTQRGPQPLCLAQDPRAWGLLPLFPVSFHVLTPLSFPTHSLCPVGSSRKCIAAAWGPWQCLHGGEPVARQEFSTP